MGRKHSAPRRGSLAFRPRGRHGTLNARIRNWPDIKSDEPTLLGFMGFKVGSINVLTIDNVDKSPTFGKPIFNHATVLSCAPMTIIGLRAYTDSLDGLSVFSEVYTNKLPKEQSRKQKLNSDYETNINKIKENLESLEKLCAIVSVPPKQAGLSQIKPYSFEIGIGGATLESQFDYLKDNLGKNVSVSEIIKPGMLVDTLGVTKGKGWQGPVKRFGIKKKQHKSRKTVREVGTVGAWSPQNIMYTVPRAGQMGFHQRTEYNKKVLFIANEKEQSINPDGGFLHFGLVPEDYVIIKGSLPGPIKRPVVLRYPIRSKKQKLDVPKVIKLSTQKGELE
ncbi:MAG: 50S ribosomal protein L3 [Thaumarchaeota archaeon]|nr:50S ribosomal protein L3 [Nitrososphaerota archaeon]|tara:strand:- start:1558 stop:2562 length:1005 start_codon:yes stop_codon:yes gene_type:complete